MPYRRVYITEKTSTKAPLEAQIAKGDIVVAAQGHLLDTVSPERIDERWSWDNVRANPGNLPIIVDDIPIAVGTDRSGKSHKPRLMEIKKALDGAQEAVIACDAGREGSLIGWEILHYCKFKGRVSRILMEKLTPEYIRAELKALDDPAEWDRRRIRDFAAYMEGKARRHEDWHVGMNGVMVATLKLRPAGWKPIMNYGGVQTPMLGLLADHEMKIRNFVPEDIFKVEMPVRAESGHDVTLVWQKGKPPLKDRSVAETIAAVARGWTGKLSVEAKNENRKPPKLHSLNSLQKLCGSMFGWRPDYTEKMAQELYDAGYASYPRTEVNYLPAEEARDAIGVLLAISKTYPEMMEVLRKGTPDAKPIIREGHTYKKEASEHYAFVPTVLPMVASRISEDARRLYQLIARYFVANHLPDAVDAVTTIQADVLVSGQTLPFRRRGRVEVKPGWRTAFGAEDRPGAEEKAGKAKEQEEDDSGALPPITNGEAGKATDAKVVAGKTSPPKRFTVAELPTVMSNLIDYVPEKYHPFLENPVNPDNPKGLGTAASRKDILPKFFQRCVVQEVETGKRKAKDPQIMVNDVGLAYIEELRRVFKQDAYPVARAVFESELKQIGEAKSEKEAMELEAKFRQRTAEKCRLMVSEIISKGQAINVSIESMINAGGYGTPGGISDKVINYVKTIHRITGAELPTGWESSRQIINAYIEANKSKMDAAMSAPAANGWDPKRIKKEGVAISVSFEEKDEAKKLGAQWNGDERTWMIPKVPEVLEAAVKKGWLSPVFFKAAKAAAA